MNTEAIFDILRIVLLVIQLLSAGITIFVFVITRRVSISTLLAKVTDWFKTAYDDGKITAEEFAQLIREIKDLADKSNTDKK